MNKLCCTVAVMGNAPDVSDYAPPAFHCKFCGAKLCAPCYQKRFLRKRYGNSRWYKIWWTGIECGECHLKAKI